MTRGSQEGQVGKTLPISPATTLSSATISELAKSIDPAAFEVLGLTLLWHPELARVGERATLDSLGRAGRAAISRNEPRFAAPGGLGRPLEDRRISRRPLGLWFDGNTLTIARDELGSMVSIDGTPLAGEVRLDLARLERGVVLELGGAIVLLLGRLDPQLDPALPSWGMVGASRGLVAVRRAIAQVADLAVPVLVRGATGSGKELVAQALHQASGRSGPFVAVNMAAIPVELAAAELFGVERGAFTGADRRRPGYFAEADGGTLFLDEVGEMPDAIQPLLLRALESAEIQPVGAAKAHRVDVRLIAATDADLEKAVAERRFREPLLHRLRGFQISLPTLAERREDIGLLLLAFLREELARAGPSDRLEHLFEWLPVGLVARFAQAPWPGNVRQLRAAVRHLVIPHRFTERIRVDAELEAQLATPRAGEPAIPPPPLLVPLAAVALPPSEPEPRKPADIDERELIAAMRASAFRPRAAAKRLGIPGSSIYDLIARCPRLRTAADLDAGEIAAAAEAHGGHVEAMAAALEVSASALRRRTRQLTEK